MIRKVKLDLADSAGDAEVVGAIDAIEKDVVEAGSLPEVHWYPGKRFLLMTLVGVTVLAVVLSALGVYLWMHDKETKERTTAKQTTESIAAKQDQVVNLSGFMINIKDGKGNLRILVCDLALEMNASRSVKDISSRVDVRNIIYATAKGRNTSWWLSQEDRQAMKKEINSRLNGLLGSDAVRTVYFTRLEIL